MRGMSSLLWPTILRLIIRINHMKNHVLEKTRTDHYPSDSAQVTRSVVLVLIEIGTDVLLTVTVTLQGGGFVIETLWI